MSVDDESDLIRDGEKFKRCMSRGISQDVQRLYTSLPRQHEVRMHPTTGIRKHVEKQQEATRSKPR